jgi:hypothetical protein
MANLDSLTTMEKPSTPKIFAVSLEGKFNSAYATRSEKIQFLISKTVLLITK